jgi:hypothetical protein
VLRRLPFALTNTSAAVQCENGADGLHEDFGAIGLRYNRNEANIVLTAIALASVLLPFTLAIGDPSEPLQSGNANSLPPTNFFDDGESNPRFPLGGTPVTREPRIDSKAVLVQLGYRFYSHS